MAADRLVMVGEGAPPKAALAGCETRTFCVVGSRAGRTVVAEARPAPVMLLLVEAVTPTCRAMLLVEAVAAGPGVPATLSCCV